MVASLRRVLSAFVVFVALTAFSAAFELRASAATLEITACTAGRVGLWVEGASPGNAVFFSAIQDDLTIVFDAGRLGVGESGGKGTAAWVNAPECFEGNRLVRFAAEVCSRDETACERKERQVRIAVRPCPTQECASTTFGLQTRGAFTPTQSCGEDGTCFGTLSAVDFTEYYSPSAKSLLLDRHSSNYCVENRFCKLDELRAGDAFVAAFKVRNAGGPGTFAIKASAGSDSLAVTPARVVLDLQRGEEKIVSFVVRASQAARPGVHEFSVKALYENVLLAEKSTFVEVLSVEEAVLTLPTVTAAGIQLLDCKLPKTISLPAEFENKGAAAEDFLIQAFIEGNVVFSRSIRVQPGLVASLPIEFDASKLKAGANVVSVTAASNKIVGAGTVNVRVDTCSSQAAATPTPQVTANEITVTTTIANTGNSVLKRVAGRVTGLPVNWTFESQVIEVPLASERNLSVKIIAATAETARAAELVVESDGVELVRNRLPPLERSGGGAGFTGLFTAGLSNPFAVLAVIAVVALAVFYYARTTGESGDGKWRREYVEKLRKIREHALAGTGEKRGGAVSEVTWIKENGESLK